MPMLGKESGAVETWRGSCQGPSLPAQLPRTYDSLQDTNVGNQSDCSWIILDVQLDQEGAQR